MNEHAQPEELKISSAREGSKTGERVGWLITVVLLAAMATFLLTAKPPTLQAVTSATLPDTVEVAQDLTIRLPSNGSFARQLARVVVQAKKTKAPLIETSGTVVAAALPRDESGDSGVR